jgi:hypothetical protein
MLQSGEARLRRTGGTVKIDHAPSAHGRKIAAHRLAHDSEADESDMRNRGHRRVPFLVNCSFQQNIRSIVLISLPQ